VRWLTRLVYVTVIVVVVGGVLLLIRAKMPATKVGEHFTAWAMFRDGSRLAEGSPVEIAGVRVGEVEQLSVVGDLARVDMRLVDDLDVPADSWITKRAESAFGDSYLEIIPTAGGELGAAPARRLRSGEQLLHVEEGSSTDTVLRSIARTMPKIDNGLDAIHQVSLDGREWANGTVEQYILNADHWLAAGNLDRPFESADHAMESFERGTTRAADAVHNAGPDILARLDRYNRGVSSARNQMRDFKTSLHDALASARDGMDRVDPTLKDLADYTEAIDTGHADDWRGTLAKLINKPDLGDSIEDGTETVASAAASLNKFRSWLGLRSEWYIYSRSANTYLSAEIRARNDKFYLIELERGPLGGIPIEELAQVPGKIPANGQYNESVTITDSLRYTAQFGKTLFGHLQVRGGIKESTPGLGADLLLGDGRLRISSDLFGSFTQVPRLKVLASIEVFRELYILGGIDDALNKPGYLPIETGNSPVPSDFGVLRYGRDYFLGASLRFSDVDLASILRTYGAMIVGLVTAP
jgi:phospholipid/cholesterol/gamma-HCH transport system substrate-binding protein